jgi:hypothetical protein
MRFEFQLPPTGGCWAQDEVATGGGAWPAFSAGWAVIVSQSAPKGRFVGSLSPGVAESASGAHNLMQGVNQGASWHVLNLCMFRNVVSISKVKA